MCSLLILLSHHPHGPDSYAIPRNSPIQLGEGDCSTKCGFVSSLALASSRSCPSSALAGSLILLVTHNPDSKRIATNAKYGFRQTGQAAILGYDHPATLLGKHHVVDWMISVGRIHNKGHGNQGIGIGGNEIEGFGGRLPGHADLHGSVASGNAGIVC